jgi:hypothetical protein
MEAIGEGSQGTVTRTDAACPTGCERCSVISVDGGRSAARWMSVALHPLLLPGGRGDPRAVLTRQIDVVDDD